MKKTIAIAVTTVISASVLGLTCFAGCAAKKTDKQTVSAYLDQEGNTIEATVDLSDGYSCEFSRGAIYIYDDIKKDNAKAIGMTMSKDVYEEYLADAEADSNHKDVKDGVIFTIGDQIGYICTVGDDAYFAIFSNTINAYQMEQIADRIVLKSEGV